MNWKIFRNLKTRKYGSADGKVKNIIGEYINYCGVLVGVCLFKHVNVLSAALLLLGELALPSLMWPSSVAYLRLESNSLWPGAASKFTFVVGNPELLLLDLLVPFIEREPTHDELDFRTPLFEVGTLC